MFFRHRAPRPPLSEFVEMFWLYEGYSQPHARESVLPTGTVELVINLREDTTKLNSKKTDNWERFRGAVICGTQTRPFIIDTAQQASVIGVHFKPGGAFPFLQMPASEFLDVHISLDEVWGSKAGELREQLFEVKTPEAKFRILEKALLEQATLPLVRHRAVSFALKEIKSTPQGSRTAALADRIGLSQRRFIEAFNIQVGLTPKVFGRIERFQKVIGYLQQRQQVDWMDVVVDHGYFDQAHFIHEFQAFSGLTPTAYLARRGPHRNHVPLPG